MLTHISKMAISGHSTHNSYTGTLYRSLKTRFWGLVILQLQVNIYCTSDTPGCQYLLITVVCEYFYLFSRAWGDFFIILDVFLSTGMSCRAVHCTAYCFPLWPTSRIIVRVVNTSSNGSNSGSNSGSCHHSGSRYGFPSSSSGYGSSSGSSYDFGSGSGSSTSRIWSNIKHTCGSGGGGGPATLASTAAAGGGAGGSAISAAAAVMGQHHPRFRFRTHLI